MGEDVRKDVTSTESNMPAPTPAVSATANSAATSEMIHDYFAPYKRISKPWDMYERFKTVFVSIFILPFRVLFLFIAGGMLFVVATVAMMGISSADDATSSEESDPENDQLFSPLPLWRKALLAIMFPIARSILFVSFGVYYIKTDTQQFSDEVPRKANSPSEAYVIVGNHLGYIDILVLLCKYRGSFVAKGELEFTPIVGRIARALQCMFVRKNQSLTSQLITRVRSTYQCHTKRKTCSGCPSCMSKLVIFPEGTTTNGTSMVAFRTGVFNAGLAVKPICIRFPYKHFNLSWETIRFREHLFRTMTQFCNRVHITELPVYEPSEAEMNDSRLFASNVQTEMARVLNQPIFPLNRKHKFLYHSYLLGKEENEAEVLMKAAKLSREDDQLVFINRNRTLDAV